MNSKTIISKIAHILATFFYVGYTPKMPGTVASLITMIMVYFLPIVSVMYSVILVGILLVGGVIVSGIFEKELGVKDPSVIVIDEVAGMLLALLCTPKTIVCYLLAFGLFRFLDIYKPFPINIPDKHMTGGWGIMLDDILAGFITGLSMLLWSYFLVY